MFKGFLAFLIVLSQLITPAFAQELTTAGTLNVVPPSEEETTVDPFRPTDYFIAVLDPGPCPKKIPPFSAQTPKTLQIYSASAEFGTDLPAGIYSWGTYTIHGFLEPESCRESKQILAGQTVDYMYSVTKTETELTLATINVLPPQITATGEYTGWAYIKIFLGGGMCVETAYSDADPNIRKIENAQFTTQVFVNGDQKVSIGTYVSGHLQNNQCLTDQWMNAGETYNFRPIIEKRPEDYPQPEAEIPVKKPSRTAISLAGLFDKKQAELRLTAGYTFLSWNHLALEADGHISGTAFYEGWYAPAVSAGLTLQEMPWPELRIQPKFSTSFMLGAENFRIQCQNGVEMICNDKTGDFSLFRQAAAVSLAQAAGVEFDVKNTHVNVAVVAAPSLGLLPLQSEMTLWRDGIESKVPYFTREPLVFKIPIGAQISIGL